MSAAGVYLAPTSNGTEPDSWTPIDLTTYPDHPPIQPTLGGIGIVYPGKRHVFSGPPESAKTLAAYAIGILTVRQGHTLILIDFEMGPYDTRTRLYELGATTAELQKILYLEPYEPATEARINALIALAPALVIIDAAAGAYDLEGLDDNKRQDVEKLSRFYVRSFWRKGIASIFVDHVVKNTETRGKFAIGSERKLGGADVHLGFETVVPISRGNSGHYKIVTHKDRGGYLKRGKLADMELTSDPDTNNIEWTFLSSGEDSEQPFRPTHLMERVSVHLETTPGEHTRNDIVAAVTGRKHGVLAAITALVTEGYAAGQSPQPVTFVRRYRESDTTCNPENTLPARVILGGSQVVPGGSQAVPELVAEGGSGGSLPYRGGTTSGTTARGHQPADGSGTSWLDDLYCEELAATVDLNTPAAHLEED